MDNGRCKKKVGVTAMSVEDRDAQIQTLRAGVYKFSHHPAGQKHPTLEINSRSGWVSGKLAAGRPTRPGSGHPWSRALRHTIGNLGIFIKQKRDERR